MKVDLLSHYGDDLMIVNTARVSYGKFKDLLDEKDEKLINYLVSHKHTSPFRHPQLQFRIQCPIYVERQLFKHQVGWSANSISGRYVDFSDTYDLPQKLRYQSLSSKQGSGDEVDSNKNFRLLAKIKFHVEESRKLYGELIKEGICKEQSRIVLPLCLETTFIWTGSFLAFMHLCDLRLKTDAQRETREVVEKMLKKVRDIKENPFKYSLKAFNYEI